ncbi:MAG: hypothetical protein LC122_14075 [Chitinophagales bacterium]|nr:hypothetical protein [Chitinophagales bacterium]
MASDYENKVFQNIDINKFSDNLADRCFDQLLYFFKYYKNSFSEKDYNDFIFEWKSLFKLNLLYKSDDLTNIVKLAADQIRNGKNDWLYDLDERLYHSFMQNIVPDSKAILERLGINYKGNFKESIESIGTDFDPMNIFITILEIDMPLATSDVYADSDDIEKDYREKKLIKKFNGLYSNIKSLFNNLNEDDLDNISMSTIQKLVSSSPWKLENFDLVKKYFNDYKNILSNLKLTGPNSKSIKFYKNKLKEFEEQLMYFDVDPQIKPLKK